MTTLSPAAPKSVRLRGLVAITGMVACALSLGTYFWHENGFENAQQAVLRKDFQSAGYAAERYLRLHPDHYEARLLAGIAHFQNDKLNPLEAANRAVFHFSKIPDDCAQGVTARLQEARATFLVLQKPSAAERLFRRVIALDQNQFDAYYLLWQLYNMTERYFECEPLFREVYRLCPPEERAYRLREWYMSQFTPLSACGELDLKMGFRQSTQPSSEEVAFRRLSAFRKHEPQEPNTAAAIAQWHLRNQSRESALEALDSITDHDAAMTESFFAATLIETLVEIGQVDRADKEFSKWTESKESYHGQRIAGIYFQEVKGDPNSAVRHLSTAAEIWPGPADWLLLNRLARCLAISGDRESSQQVHSQAERVESLTDLKIHQQIRLALASLDDPDALQEVVRFYDEFGRDWESAAWKQVISEFAGKTFTQSVIP